MTRTAKIASFLGAFLFAADTGAAEIRTSEMAAKNLIETRVFIPHPPAAVWSVLTDTDSYPRWNPFIRRMTGDLRSGGKIEIALATEGTGRLQSFSPTVVECVDGRELRWIGHVMLPNLIFTGEHYFLLEPKGDGTVVTHGETFRGIAVPLIGIRKFAAKFEAMNAALASEVARRQN